MKNIKQKKQKAGRIPRSYDTTTIGGEPNWDKSIEHKQIEIIRALNWYNYFYEPKLSVKALLDNYDGPEDISNIKLLNEINVPTILGNMCRMKSLGCNFSDTNLSHFDKVLQATIMRANKLKEAQDAIKSAHINKLTVQQLTENKLMSQLGEVEGVIDDFIINGYKTDFDMYEWIRIQQIKPKQCKRIAEIYQPMADELKEAYEEADPDLKEGYSNLRKFQLKKLIGLVECFVDDATRSAANGKVSRVKKPRAKKNIPINKKLEKLSYMKEFNELKIVSADPTGIIGAQHLWMYNTKYKTLTHFVAADRGGFDIKGTTLLNWSDTESEGRKLRNPQTVVENVISGGKIKLKKLLGELTTRATTVKGRINNNMIILKIIR